MNPEPGFESFSDLYGTGRAQVVWTRLIDDLETPVSAYLKLANGRPYAFLFESVEGGAWRGRYSVIAGATPPRSPRARPSTPAVSPPSPAGPSIPSGN